MSNMVKLVASAAFALLTFAGVQSASAQTTCYAPDEYTTSQNWDCGPVGRSVAAHLVIGITEASVNTSVLSLRGIPHEIHIKLDCAHDTEAENQEAFSINDQSDRVSCPNGNAIQRASAWIVLDPRGGSGQGGSEGEGGDEGGGDEGGSDEGGDQGGDHGGDEGGE